MATSDPRANSASVTNPSDDSSSSYYLYPSDNPGALLVFEIFIGENYVAWSRSISSSNDFRFRVSWMRANNLILSWLMNSIAKEIHGSLLYFSSAFDIWEELKTSYLQSDGPQIVILEKFFSSISLLYSLGSKSVTEYFSDFKTLWDEYINYQPIPSC
ncbi:hypothetical protein F2P56_008013 [Juglans regia]|uniref:Retrotransposon Copia-like N-terminal domain-containing protein n=1 Tax=Juglans regia TaxID=51240 RepID=A0A833XS82_JUGRE|nr:hypothetical protein F2P56_008013 [Juglans regia]